MTFNPLTGYYETMVQHATTSEIDEATKRLRMSIHRKFFRMCGNLRCATVDFVHGRESKTIGDGSFQERVVDDKVDLHNANAISSLIKGSAWPANPGGRHKVLLDLDCPHEYIPSSTPGHGHLIIDVELAWPAYLNLLKTLARYKILEYGYVAAAEFRQATWLRTPWAGKDTEDDAVKLD